MYSQLRHKQIEAKIEEQNKISKDDYERHVLEVEDLSSDMKKNDSLLEDWMKLNTERNSALHSLQEDMKSGLMVNACDVFFLLLFNASNLERFKLT